MAKIVNQYWIGFVLKRSINWSKTSKVWRCTVPHPLVILSPIFAGNLAGQFDGHYNPGISLGTLAYPPYHPPSGGIHQFWLGQVAGVLNFHIASFSLPISRLFVAKPASSIQLRPAVRNARSHQSIVIHQTSQCRPLHSINGRQRWIHNGQMRFRQKPCRRASNRRVARPRRSRTGSRGKRTSLPTQHVSKSNPATDSFFVLHAWGIFHTVAGWSCSLLLVQLTGSHERGPGAPPRPNHQTRDFLLPLRRLLTSNAFGFQSAQLPSKHMSRSPRTS